MVDKISLTAESVWADPPEILSNPGDWYQRVVVDHQPRPNIDILTLDRGSGRVVEEHSLEDSRSVDDTIVWVDIQNPTPEELEKLA